MQNIRFKKDSLLPYAEKLLKSVKLTRRTILAKIAEFYDPCGFWEITIKLQRNLATIPLKGLDWDEQIPELEQAQWSELLTTFVELNDIQSRFLR